MNAFFCLNIVSCCSPSHFAFDNGMNNILNREMIIKYFHLFCMHAFDEMRKQLTALHYVFTGITGEAALA